MTCNVGNTDRIVRGVIGLALIGFAVATKSWWALIGIVPLATAIFRFCPAYIPFKINTSGK